MLSLLWKLYFFAPQTSSATKEVLVLHLVNKSQHYPLPCHDEYFSFTPLQSSWRWKMVGVSQKAICFDYVDPEGVDGD